MTPGLITVALIEFDQDLAVSTPSEYEQWPDTDDFEAPAGMGRLLVQVTDSDSRTYIAGAVSWHVVSYGPTSGSRAWNIGIGLIEAARGHRIGTVAQRLLTEWLLETTPLNRIEASTDIENHVEQRALENAGFTREGLLRSAQERLDGRHDLIGYSFLRTDLPA
ncbi:MAG: GNAT family protein [Actinomycetes bacterium]